MGLAFEDLTPETRSAMLDEIELAIRENRIYIAENRLTAKGKNDYCALLKAAAEHHNDQWLTEQLSAEGMMRSHQERRKADGTTLIVKVPSNAGETLAEGEFNKYYILALCRRAQVDVEIRLVVYRAKTVSTPRPESERLLGTVVQPRNVLGKLRANEPWETEIGLAQPNSGLTLRIERVKPVAVP